MDKSSVTLDMLAQEFEMFNKVEGKSPGTVAMYNWVRDVLDRFLQATGHSSQLGNLDLSVLRRDQQPNDLHD